MSGWLYVDLQVAARLDEVFGRMTAFDKKLRLSELQLQ
jgi:hypothetical protein